MNDYPASIDPRQLVLVHVRATSHDGSHALARGVGLAGVVEAVGAHVTAFRTGDEVCGVGDVPFGSYACLPQRRLARIPPALDFDGAARSARLHPPGAAEITPFGRRDPR